MGKKKHRLRKQRIENEQRQNDDSSDDSDVQGMETNHAELAQHSNSAQSTKSIQYEKSSKKNVSSVPLQKIKGLSNLGNTCFFNAVMQSLSQTPVLECVLSNHIQKDTLQTLPGHQASDDSEPDSDSSPLCSEDEMERERNLKPLNIKLPEGGPLTRSLVQFLKEMHSTSRASVVSPSALFGQICCKAPRFKGFQQQDSHELLRHLLDGMKAEEIKRSQTGILNFFNLVAKGRRQQIDDDTKTTVKAYGRQLKHTFVDSVFGGYFISTVLCEECHHPSQIFEPFQDISLPIMEERASRPNSNWSYKKKECMDENVKGGERSTPEKSMSRHQTKKAKKAAQKELKKRKKRNRLASLSDMNKGHTHNEAAQTKENDDIEHAQVSVEISNETNTCKNGILEKGVDISLDNEIDGNPEVSDRTLICKVDGISDELGDRSTDCAMDRDVSQKILCEVDGTPNKDVEKTPCKDDGMSEKVVEKTNVDEISHDVVNITLVYKVDGNSNELGERTPENVFNGTCNMTSKSKDNGMSVNSCNETSELTQLPSDRTETCKTNCIADDWQKQDKVENETSKPGCEEISARGNLEEGRKMPENQKVGRMKQEANEESNHSSCEEWGSKSDADIEDNWETDTSRFAAMTSDGMTTDAQAEPDKPEPQPTDKLRTRSLERNTTSSTSSTIRNTTSLDDITDSLSTMSIGTPPAGGMVDGDKVSMASIASLSHDDREPWSSLNLDIKEKMKARRRERSEVRQDAEKHAMSTMATRYQPAGHECSLESCLNQFTAAELLTGNNKFGCSNCTKLKNAKSSKKGKKEIVYANASKQTLLFCPPAILTLHLKRFQQVGFTMRKVNRHVEFPLVLDIAPFCSSLCLGVLPNQGKVLYSLYGVVEHSGSMRGGHYTAYVKMRPKNEYVDKFLQHSNLSQRKIHRVLEKLYQPDDLATPKEENSRGIEEANIAVPPGKWYYISDSRVNEVSEQTVLKCQAYLLFYERIF